MNLSVIEANRRVHSELILSGEYQKSPHRRRESAKRLQALLAQLRTSKNVEHLDIGCGDGFLFECKPEGWVSHGIDVTPEMLNECAINHPSVKLEQGFAESLPYLDASFDVVTCYSFLDHIESTDKFYAEAIRVLKPGGLFYFGLSPNRDFYLSLKQTELFELSDFLKNELDVPLELQKAFDDGAYYEKNHGINKMDLLSCEPGKTLNYGLSPIEEIEKLKVLGVQQIKIEHEWIFQQNRLGPEAIEMIKKFLPFTSPCFKYFDLIGEK